MNDRAATVRAGQPGSRQAGSIVSKPGAPEGGRLSAALVVRVLGGALRGRSGWSILERRRLSDIRVELRMNIPATKPLPRL